MASVRYIVLAACQNAGLYAQAGWESEAAAWIKKQGSRPCAYVGYRRGQGVAGFDNVSVVFGGSDPRAALRRVRDSLERSLEFRSERQTEVDGFPALELTARSKRRVYGVFGGGARPVPPVPPTDLPFYFEAVNSNSTVALMSMLETAPNLEYSTDGETWQAWQHTTAEGTHTFDTLTLTAVGDKVYFRGVNSAGFFDVENQKPSLFSMTGKIAAGGNAQSLVDGDTPTLVAKTMPFFSDFAITGQPSDVLTQAPALTATTLADGCYFGMFVGCTGLTQAPALPATTLADDCYSGMFSGCTGLTQAPALPATTLADDCYSGMFSGCTGLTQAPALPATTLAEGCYSGMFDGCTGLTQAPALPATTLAEYCYADMFASCTGLTQAPTLPATTLADYCYDGMFEGCTFNMSDDGTTFNFQCDATLPQTVGESTFSTPAELAGWMGNTNGFLGPMYFEAVEANSTFRLMSTLESAPNLEYSTDGETWQEWQHTTVDGTHTFDTLTLTAVGDRVYLRGDNPDGLGAMPEGEEMPLFSFFEMTGKIASGGNIMSLLDSDIELTEVPSYGLYSLFYGVDDVLLTSPSMENITVIDDHGCEDMFHDCYYLASAAAMSAVTDIGENGCANMYNGCTSLAAAAAMPALTNISDGGCSAMFDGCTFDMSNDGSTLNFAFPTPPITAGQTTYATAYDVASWMGNTNGFTNP